MVEATPVVSNNASQYTPFCGLTATLFHCHEQIFCSDEKEFSTTERTGSCLENPETAGEDLHSARPAPHHTREASSQYRRMWRFEKRLELAEFSVAIAESVKLWMSVVPWSVTVLYGGEPVLSRLRTKEEALPWPPDPGTSLDIEDKQLSEMIASEGAGTPVFLKPKQQHCRLSDVQEEENNMEVGVP